MSPLKGMLMREDDKEAGRGRTDGRRRQERCEGLKNEFAGVTFIPSILLIFALCRAICQEGCSSHVASLQSVNYGYLSFSHNQNCHFLLCQFVGAADDSLLW